MSHVPQASLTDALPAFTRRAAIVIGLSLLGIALAVLIWFTARVFLLAFAGLLFGIFLSTLAEWFGRLSRLKYGWALTVVVLLLVGVMALGIWFTGNQIAGQIDALYQALAETAGYVQDYLAGFGWTQQIMRDVRQTKPGELVQPELLTRTTGLFAATATFIGSVVIVVFIGLYGAADPRLYRKGVLHLVPLEKRQRAAEVIDSVIFALRWWLIGQVISMIFVGVLTFLGLYFLGVPLALALGLLSFGMELVPNLGPFIAAAPGLLVALTQGYQQLVYVGLLYLTIQSLESYVLMPLIQMHMVRLPPVISILAIILFGLVGGLLGVFVAAPLTVAIMVLVKQLYVRDVLGDESVKGLAEAKGDQGESE